VPSFAGGQGPQGAPHCPPLAGQSGAQGRSGVCHAVLLEAARPEHVLAAAPGARHAAAARHWLHLASGWARPRQMTAVAAALLLVGKAQPAAGVLQVRNAELFEAIIVTQ